MTFRIYGQTHMGIGKEENQDRLLIGQQVCDHGAAEAELCCGIAALSDGVGGNPGGAEAAGFVLEAFAGQQTVTEDLMHRINARLLCAAPPEKRTMAATVAGLCFADGGITLFSVGNTRVYAVLRGKYLKQLTPEDTTVARLLTLGQITPAQARNHPRRSEITACFGGGAPELLTPHVRALTQPGSGAYLITTDGIHDYVDIDELESLVAENLSDPPRMCQKLLEAARNNGSSDDASILLCAPEP